MTQSAGNEGARQPELSTIHISETPLTFANWYKHINWENVFWVIGLPIIGLIAATFHPLQTKTAIWAATYHITTGVGITAGYHRLWAHRSYTASLPLKIWLAAVGGGAIEDSIRTWSRDHRAHHRYTDTDKDPYSVRKGLLYAHIGWLVFRQDPKRLGRVDVSDLDRDPVVVWQHNHYTEVALVMGFILPCGVAGLWSDWWGGLVYAGIIRAFTVQQSTFCVNSVAHWLGDQTFDDRNSPRDHIFTALITAGEGYHNFHHEFPSDYRNAIAWYQFDPTKWSIRLWKQIGLANDLKQFRQNEIEIGKLQQQQKHLDRNHAQIQWPLEQLPLIEWDDFKEQAMNGRSLITIAGVVHDVGKFVMDHPGGKALISSGIGKDATAMFNGGLYNHSRVAHILLATMHIGIIRGGGEVEIRKRAWATADASREYLLPESARRLNVITANAILLEGVFILPKQKGLRRKANDMTKAAKSTLLALLLEPVRLEDGGDSGVVIRSIIEDKILHFQVD